MCLKAGIWLTGKKKNKLSGIELINNCLFILKCRIEIVSEKITV
jgi:hypothetical protein